MAKRKNMKLSNRMAFVMDMISERWLLFMLVVVMGIVSFLLVDYCVMFLLEQNEENLLANEILAVSTDQVYQIEDANIMNAMHEDMQRAFGEKFVQSGLWDSLSVYSVSMQKSFRELQENADYTAMMEAAYAGTRVSEHLAYNQLTTGDLMYVYTGNRNMMEMVGVQLPEAVQPDTGSRSELLPVYIGSDLAEFLQPGQMLSPIYLGYALKRNPDGINLSNCYVAGVLKKGTKVLSDHYTGTANVGLCLDKMILLLNEDLESLGYQIDPEQYRYNTYMWFQDAETAARQLAAWKREAQPLFEQYDMKLSIRTVDAVIEEAKAQEQSVQFLLLMAILLMIAGFMAFSTTSMISTLLHKRQYGIMLANGVSHADLTFMVMWETIYKYLLSLMIAFGLMHSYYLTRKQMLYTGMDEYAGCLRMHLNYALPALLLLTVIGIIIATAIPVKMIKRLSLMELMQV